MRRAIPVLFALLVLPSAGAWHPAEPGAPLPVFCSNAPGVAWNGTILVMGGCHRAEEQSDEGMIVRFDPATGASELARTTLPAPACCGLAFAHHGQVYSAHMENTSARIWRYDPLLDIASPMNTSLTAGRIGGAVAYDGRYAYFAGGFAPDARRILRYDPETDNTTLLSARLATRGDGTTAIFANGSIYFFGEGLYEPRSAEIQRFDIANGTVTSLDATLPEGRALASAVWDGARVLVLGGDENGDVLSFDPEQGTVSVVGRIPIPFQSAAVALVDGRVWALAGSGTTSGASNVVRSFDVATGQGALVGWTPPTGRLLAAAASDGDAIFAFGGVGQITGPTEAIARYDLASGTTRVMPTHLPARLERAAAVWTGGEFLIFGGMRAIEGEDFPSSTSERVLRYDPATGRLTEGAHQPDWGYGPPSVSWDGTQALVVPLGSSKSAAYDPATDTFEELNISTRNYGEILALASDGREAYAFAGDEPRILRLNVANGAFTPVNASLPSADRGAVALRADDRIAYVMREQLFSPADRPRHVYVFDPATMSVESWSAHVPLTRYESGSDDTPTLVWAAGALFDVGHAPTPIRIDPHAGDTFAYRVVGGTVELDATALLAATPGARKIRWTGGPTEDIAVTTFEAPRRGLHKIGVIVEGDDGILATHERSIAVWTNSAPVAAFRAQASGTYVDIEDQSADADDRELSYTWDWGDNATDASRSPSHVYARPGTYEITLVVRDPQGATGIARQEVTIVEEPFRNPVPIGIETVLAAVALALALTSFRASRR